MQLPELNAEEMLKLVRFLMLYPHLGREISWPQMKVAARMVKARGYSMADALVALSNALSFWVRLRQPMIADPYRFLLYEMPLFLPKKPEAFS